jgi:hypothetical protein
MENARLGRAVADLTLDKQILKEAAGETIEPQVPPRLRGGGPRGLGAGTLLTEPGSPWENGYRESLDGKYRG